MSTLDDFYSTAERMYNDLELLFREKRWFNTCYFGGYIVECYAKLILSKVLGKKPAEIRVFSHNLQNLNLELQNVLTSFITGGKVPPNYLCDVNSMCPTICLGLQAWHPEKRYGDGNSYWDENTAKDYHKEVNDLIVIIVQMKIDGVI